MLAPLAHSSARSASMFRDGQYLEVIKASDNCLATAVVTVQERTVEIEKQKVITNKWLQVEDWAALYKILERAILRNVRDNGSHREGRGCERRKSTRQLEVTYTFEHAECASEATTSLPTIKVHVSPAKKGSGKRESSSGLLSKSCKAKRKDDTAKHTKEDKSERITDTRGNRSKSTIERPAQTFPRKVEAPRTASTEQDSSRRKKRKYDFSDDLKNVSLEEYIPDAPGTKKSCIELKYVPSQKSALGSMPLDAANEYTPNLCSSKRGAIPEDVNYVPNSIGKLTATYEMYEPSATTTIPSDILEGYVPNSKGARSSVEEYEPGFKSPSKLTKFDDSYVPSSVRQGDFRGMPDKSGRLKVRKIEAHRRGALPKKRMDLFS